jgi:Zn-finger domain-containing protein
MRHNFVLCYDLQYGGFRVRKNDRLNPQKEKVIAVVDEDYKEGLKIKYVPLVQVELMKIRGEHRREESIKNRKSKR